MSYQPKLYRKFLASITAVAVVASMAVPAASADTTSTVQTKKFSDVKDDYWAAKEIYSLVEKGIIKGYQDNTYKPNQPIIRGHVANLLTTALNLTVPSDLKAFDDVDSKSEFAKGAAATKAAGIFEGYDKRFNAKGVLTREQMASVLVRAFNLKTPVKGQEIKFTDSKKIGSAHQADVIVLAQNGITLGNKDGSFDPQGAVTRASFAVFLERALKTLDKDTYDLAVMHTNDTHANLDSVAKKATAIKDFRAKNKNSLLIDAGDVMSGTLYFNEFKGQADLEFMNIIGYDVMTFGNHEFDLGSTAEGHKALADFVKSAKFPFVSANVDFSKDTLFNGLYKGGTYTDKPENGNIYSGIVKEVDGEKIGIFGLTTVDTPDISSPEKVEFLDYLAKAEEAVANLEKAGVDKIVAVSHLGYDDNPAIDNDLELAKLVDGIDIIVGGHTHTQLNKPVLINKDENGKEKEPTVIVQANEYNKFLGTLDVEFDENGVIVGYAGELITIADRKEDPETATLLKGYSSKIDEIKNTETGAVAVNKLENPRQSDGKVSVSVRSNETPLGNLISDGMLAKAKEYFPKTVIAVNNGGGIRAEIDKGPITLGEILTTMPYGNTLAVMTLKGTELIAALEHSVKETPKESGGFLHVSGMKFTYDSSKPVGERVISVEVAEEEGKFTPLDKAKEYVIATSTFTAKGGDGYSMFAKAYEEGRVTDLGHTDWSNFLDYVVKLKTVDPKVEGRIIDLAPTKK
ncbi:5'-nucleotidase C-terminal domain-containing protein [Robertmurraya andreesenii]|uniref:2',3'-cyclic-nucleotide 2'-phosphodiesterase (5'-nucleotidase family) n=1 Tax=Anoxybacillus andreesenii TaxID=1325932 RepID=A0ABT9UZT7_9BACL|nr:5'-nucleotidase C-terminal domain-containing protein [Robertmurraya andreesenii]MDQ0154204.1 2',3'-cyclic-nucleotide 2'-phosphodiesterase (5'-nucleotidase family) [Robertmurraya andreesenii]